MQKEEETTEKTESLSEKIVGIFEESFMPAFSGMSLIVLSLASFLIFLYIVLTIVRTIAGFTV